MSDYHIVNTTPHPITFVADPREPDAETFTVLPCGTVISAQPQEDEAYTIDGITFVRTTFRADAANQAALQELERREPEGTIFIGSIVAAQAFPGRICAMIPASGYERVPVEQKRMRPDRFTIF